MTNEQIKQNAELYAINGNTRGSLSLEILFQNTRDAFIAGAHSRDEEIESLQRRVSMWKHEAEVAAKELDQLRNPWISVEDRLPEEALPLVVVNKSGNRYYCYYNASIEEFVTIDPDGDLWNVCEVTHWMPIPPPPPALKVCTQNDLYRNKM